MTYKKYNQTEAVQRDDGAIIFPGANGWDQYQAWLKGGNKLTESTLPIEARRDAVWQKVKAERDLLMDDVVVVDGVRFDSDQRSRIQQIGLNMLGDRMQDGLTWKTSDNVMVPMTPKLAADIFAATAEWDAKVFYAAEAIRNEIIKSDAPESIDITVGWPS